MPGGRKPPHKRDQAIRALIESGSVEEAADRCGVSERTLRSWLKEPAFRDAYRQARRKLLDGAVLLLQRASRRAVRALVRQLQADKPADVIRAAEAILDRAFKGTEVLDLVAAVEELQRQVEESKRGTGSSTAAGREVGGDRQRDGDRDEPGAGGDPPGPGVDPQPGGDAPGPLAGPVTPLFP
jgi:DNA-binding transcriptional MerR regulator